MDDVLPYKQVCSTMPRGLALTLPSPLLFILFRFAVDRLEEFSDVVIIITVAARSATLAERCDAT